MRQSCHVITSFVLVLGIASAHANEPRILSETVVGEIPGNNQPVSPEKTNEIVRSVGDAGGEDQILEQVDPIALHPIEFQISADLALSQIFTDPITPRIATSLKSDPISGAFGLSGIEKSLRLKRVDTRNGLSLGVEASKGSFDGSISLRQGLDTANVSTLDSTVDIDVTSFGLNIGRVFQGNGTEKVSGSVSLGITHHDYDLVVRDRVNAYLLGFAFPSNDVETMSSQFISADLGISHHVSLDEGLRLGVTQKYRTPVSGDSGRYTQFSTQIGVSKDFGPGTRNQTNSFDYSSGTRCHAVELVVGDGFATFSGNETSSSAKRSIDVESELGWSSSQSGARVRFGDGREGCHQLGFIRADRKVDYRVRGLDVDSSINAPLSGYELRYNWQPSLIKSEGNETYLSLGTGLWVGDGESSNTSSFTFDNVSSTQSDNTELLLIDLGVGLGFRQFVSERQYVFYELSTSRYDGRPLGKDVYGWENNARVGVGFNF